MLGTLPEAREIALRRRVDMRILTQCRGLLTRARLEACAREYTEKQGEPM